MARASLSQRRDGSRPSPTSATQAKWLERRRQEILAETASQLLAGHDPVAEVLPQLYSSLAAEFAVDASIGFVVTEMRDGMRLSFARGFEAEAVERCLRLDFGQAVCGTVGGTGRAIHVSNVQGSLDPMTDLIRSLGITAYACEPLIADGRTIGTLSFGSRSRASFASEDLRFFAALARLVASAWTRRTPPVFHN